MKAEQIRELDAAEIGRTLVEMQEQMFRFKFQFGMGQLEGVKKYRELRKDRARMLGALREREIDPAKEAAAAAVAAKKTKRTAKAKTAKAKKDQ